MRMAAKAMINSAALPKVALSKPPMAGPVRSAMDSVAFPIKKPGEQSRRS